MRQPFCCLESGRPHVQTCLLLVYLSGLFVISSAGALAEPEWIWSSATPEKNQTVYFRKTFTVPANISSATLYGACDNELTAYVNGKKVLRNTTWKQAEQKDVTTHLKNGKNVLSVIGRNKASAAGLLMKLTVKRKGGEEKTLLETDDSWNVSGNVSGESWLQLNYNDSDWTSAHSFGELGTEPWGKIRLTPPPMPAMSTPPGFRIERLHRVPSSQGSWVSLTFLPDGRMVTSAQNGPLYLISSVSDTNSVEVEELNIRVTKPDGDKKSKPLGGAQGLTWAFESLYVVLNKGNHGFGRGLYRVRDQDGDGKLDGGTLLKKINARGEHGLHGVRKGPEANSLYLIAGNHTKPLDVDHSRQPPVWQEDLLLPRIPPPSGHASGIKAPAGNLYRTDPEGKHWELIANGMRNAYDFDFNRHGEPFTFDADMEYDIGLPWYRPTRVAHIPSGAEFGWRNGSGKWPSYYPDSVPPTVDIGQSSPTGVTFGYGSNFPEKYREALFVGDWSLGRIFAVHLTPDGASYRGTAEDFITGKPLPVTDMEIGPDGALYFITGGRGTTTSIYRVSYTGTDSAIAEDQQDVSQEKKKSARKARALRHRLEQLHQSEVQFTEEKVNFAWSHLSSGDRFIRYAARIAVEHAPLKMWRNKALNESDPQTLIMAQLALARHGKEELKPDMLKVLSRLNFKKLNRQQKRALLRVYGVIFSRMGPPERNARSAVIKQINPHFPAEDYTVNKELSRVLGYLEAPGVIEKTLGLIEQATANDQEVHYGYVLRTIENGWSKDQRKAFFRWVNRAMNYGGGHQFTAYVREIKKRALDTMSDGEKEQLASVIEGSDEGTDQPEVRTNIVKNWTMEDLLPAVKQSLSDRNYQRGKRMYRVAQCSKCHNFNGKGGITGPDLTTVGQRFSREYILESIVNPSAEISNRYRRSVITKDDGSKVIGRIVNMHGDTLHVMTNPMDPSNLTDVNRSGVTSIEPSDTSSMPPGLINTLNKQEVLDLFAYLLSGGDPDHEMFRNQ